MEDLKLLSKKIRIQTLEMIHKSHASHIASAFSIVEILACLYGGVMNITPDNCDDPDRDIFILSKGHAASAVYATLYLKGFLSQDEIDNYYQNGSFLSGHVSKKGVKGIEFSTGSLGHGASVACGFALSKKLSNEKGKVYVIVGDGECDEGCIWEMAMFAKQQNLNNLVIIVDKNKMQAMGETKNIIDLDNLSKKWEDFGFYVQEVDGNNTVELIESFKKINDSLHPNCIIANTIKGKGVSFMENNIIWHYRDPQNEMYEQAKKELTDAK